MRKVQQKMWSKTCEHRKCEKKCYFPFSTETFLLITTEKFLKDTSKAKSFYIQWQCIRKPAVYCFRCQCMYVEQHETVRLEHTSADERWKPPLYDVHFLRATGANQIESLSYHVYKYHKHITQHHHQTTYDCRDHKISNRY